MELSDRSVDSGVDCFGIVVLYVLYTLAGVYFRQEGVVATAQLTSGTRTTRSRESPRYSIPEAAAYLEIPTATLDSWVRGRSYRLKSGKKEFWKPLIFRPVPEDPRLSFSNLIEAHVLRALRVAYAVDMDTARASIDFAEREAGIKRLLLSDKLLTALGELFIDHLGRLLNVGRGGQVAMREILGAYLQRVDRDVLGPFRLFPFTRPTDLLEPGPKSPRNVVIDPAISFGRPVTVSRAIRTATIAERFNAGESIADIAGDYNMSTPDVEEALRYERRPRVQAAA